MSGYTVYVHETPDGKRYVGCTKQNPRNRFLKEGKGYNRNESFWKAIIFFGWDNIKHIIVASELSATEASSLERELISKYKSNNPNYGYNKTFGGEIRKHIPQRYLTPIEYGLKIRFARKQLNLSVKSLAHQVGVSSRCIYSYESGERTPKASTRIIIERTLKITKKYLMDCEQEVDDLMNDEKSIET